MPSKYNPRKRSIEGVVLERFEDGPNGYISATLLDAGGFGYYAEIDLDRFDDTEQPHCQPGVSFTISAGSELKLRRRTCRCDGGNCQCRKVAS